MPFRRRFVRGRRPRRRTRWLAVTPGSRAALASNTFAANQLTMEDAQGNVLMSEFIGGTILRVLLDVQILYTLDGTPSGTSGSIFSHAGVFLTADTTPEGTTWSPNAPSGDFMQRTSYGAQLIYGTSDLPTLTTVPQTGYAHRFDTQVRRRIRENDKLWLGFLHFINGTSITGVDYGWTGRVLIALP